MTDIDKTPEEVAAEVAATEKAAADKAAADKTGDGPETFEITVNGVAQNLTIDELRARAEKASGADARFQEAAAARKQAADGLEVKDLMDKIKAGTAEMTDLQQFATLAGLSPEDFNELYGQISKGSDTEGDVDANVAIEKADLSPELQGEFEEFHKERVERMKNKMVGESKSAVDNDQILGKITTSEGADPKKTNLVYKKMEREVQRRVLLGEPYSAELLTAALQTVRAELDGFGMLAPVAQQADVITALGPAASGIAQVLQANKPIEAVAVTDDNYSENLFTRWAAKTLGRG